MVSSVLSREEIQIPSWNEKAAPQLKGKALKRLARRTIRTVTLALHQRRQPPREQPCSAFNNISTNFRLALPLLTRTLAHSKEVNDTEGQCSLLCPLDRRERGYQNKEMERHPLTSNV